MGSISYNNETQKRKFYEYLKNFRGFSGDTIRCYEKAIWLWEDFSDMVDFAYFNATKATEFVGWLKKKKKKNSENVISLSYCYDILRFLKVFFEWLSKQGGFKLKISQSTVEYLTLTKAEIRKATQPRRNETPSIEEVKKTIENICGNTEVEMRDKALISLMFLTGARISAVMTLSLGCFDKEKMTIYQDPNAGVHTKFSKLIISAFIPSTYMEPAEYFMNWFNYLEKQKGFKPADPIFPATKVENGKENLNYYNTGEVEPIFWKSTSSVRKIFQKRFEQAGVKYYHPHTLRHLVIKEISKLPLTEEEKKAISQNLGHESIGTTFSSYGYGKVTEDRQIDLVRSLNFDGKQVETKLSMTQEELKLLAKYLLDDATNKKDKKV